MEGSSMNKYIKSLMLMSLAASMTHAVAHAMQPDAAAQPAAVAAERVVLGDRPAVVQAAIDEAFEVVKDLEGEDAWGYNGEPTYNLVGLDDERLLQSLFKLPDVKIFIIDIGCGQGLWGRNAVSVLWDYEERHKTGKRFRIFSLTGGRECDNVADFARNEEGRKFIKHHRCNNMALENIQRSLYAEGYDLKNKCSLIMCRWTLRHLVDPVGTLKEIHDLLKPGSGMLLGTGFYYALEGIEEPVSSAVSLGNGWDILAQSNATILCKKFEHVRDEFLLMRSGIEELKLPFEYTGKVRDIEQTKYDCASGKVTEFRKLSCKVICAIFHKMPRIRKRKRTDDVCNQGDVPVVDSCDAVDEQKALEEMTSRPAHELYYAQGSQESKKLYECLRREDLFYRDQE